DVRHPRLRTRKLGLQAPLRPHAAQRGVSLSRAWGLMSPNAPLQLTHSRIKLLIADDRWVVREGLKRMIAQCADMKVVGEAATPDDVLERLQPTEVDVILLDAWLGGPKTRGLIREVRRRHARCREIGRASCRERVGVVEG